MRRLSVLSGLAVVSVIGGERAYGLSVSSRSGNDRAVDKLAITSLQPIDKWTIEEVVINGVNIEIPVIRLDVPVVDRGKHWSLESIKLTNDQDSLVYCDKNNDMIDDCSKCYEGKIYSVDSHSDEIIIESDLSLLSDEIIDIRSGIITLTQPIQLDRNLSTTTITIIPVVPNEHCRFVTSDSLNIITTQENEYLAPLVSDSPDLTNLTLKHAIPPLSGQMSFQAQTDCSSCTSPKCGPFENMKKLSDKLATADNACTVDYINITLTNPKAVIGFDVVQNLPKTATSSLTLADGPAPSKITYSHVPQKVAIFSISTAFLKEINVVSDWTIHLIKFEKSFTGDCSQGFTISKITSDLKSTTTPLEFKTLNIGKLEWTLAPEILFNSANMSDGIRIDTSGELFNIAILPNNPKWGECNFDLAPQNVRIDILSNSYDIKDPKHRHKVWDDAVQKNWISSYTIKPQTTCDTSAASNCHSQIINTFASAQECYAKFKPNTPNKPCLVDLINTVKTIPLEAFNYYGSNYLAFSFGYYKKTLSGETDVHILDPITDVQFHPHTLKFTDRANATPKCNKVRIATIPLPLDQDSAKIHHEPTYLPNQMEITTLPQPFTFIPNQFNPNKDWRNKMFMAIPNSGETSCNWGINSTTPVVELIGQVQIPKAVSSGQDKTSFRLEYTPGCKVKPECDATVLMDEKTVVPCLEAARAHACQINIVKIIHSNKVIGKLSTDKRSMYPSVMFNPETINIATVQQPHVVKLKLRTIEFKNKFSKSNCNDVNIKIIPDAKSTQTIRARLPNKVVVPISISDKSNSISAEPVTPNPACVWPLYGSGVTLEFTSGHQEYAPVESVHFNPDKWEKSYIIETVCENSCVGVVHSSIGDAEKCINELLGEGCGVTVIVQAVIQGGEGFSGIPYNDGKTTTVPIVMLNNLYEKIHNHPLKLKSVWFGSQYSEASCNNVDIISLKRSTDVNNNLLPTDLDLSQKLEANLPYPIIFNPLREGVNELVAIPRDPTLRCAWSFQSTKPTIILSTDKIIA